MASLAELEETSKVNNPPIDAEYVGEEGDEMGIMADLHDAFVLLNKSVTLLNYVSDADMCKIVSKRERDVMFKLAQGIKNYLDEVEGNYEE